MRTNNQTIPSTPFWLCILSTLGAVGIHFYLKQLHYAHKYGFGVENSMCDINDKFSCAVASASGYSEIFGVPLALLGAIINGILLVFLVGFRFSLFSKKALPTLPSVIKIIAVIIFATSVIMGLISAMVIHSLCPFCVGAYVLSAVTLVTAFMAFPGGLSFGAKPLQWVAGAMAFSVALSLGWHQTNLLPYGGKRLAKMNELRLEDWKGQSVKTIETVSSLAYNSPATAKMKIVEFADFLCGHCKTAFPKIHSFVKAHSDVSLEFQAFPLDGSCNEGMSSGDGVRCYLARLSHCGGQQEKGWDIQGWIFQNQTKLTTKSRAKEKLPEAISKFALDKERLQSCLESEETHQTIKSQAALGRTLGIEGTPSIFVNGKRVQGFDLSILQSLYNTIKKATPN